MLLVEKVRNALVVLANEQSGPLRLVFVIPLGQKMVPVDTQQEFLAPSCTHCSSKKVKCDRLHPAVSSLLLTAMSLVTQRVNSNRMRQMLL